jgi:hypothetical protein
MTSIDDIAIDAIVEQLRKKMNEEVADTSYHVETLRGGRLQNDPTRGTGLSILVHFDVEGNQLTEDTNRSGRLVAPPYMLGGGHHFMHRYRVEVKFFIKERDREAARRKALLLFNRTRNAVYHMPLPLEKDDFGECVVALQPREFFIKENGGQGQFNWEGEVLVEFLTEYPPIPSPQ